MELSKIIATVTFAFNIAGLSQAPAEVAMTLMSGSNTFYSVTVDYIVEMLSGKRDKNITTTRWRRVQSP